MMRLKLFMGMFDASLKGALDRQAFRAVQLSTTPAGGVGLAAFGGGRRVGRNALVVVVPTTGSSDRLLNNVSCLTPAELC